LIILLGTKICRWLFALVRRTTEDQLSQMQRESAKREWIKRKFVYHDGLVYHARGHMVAMQYAWFHLTSAILIVLVTIILRALLSGVAIVDPNVLLGAGAILAVAQVWKANRWVSPLPSGVGDTNSNHWARVKELEEELFERADDDTVEYLNKHSGSPRTAEQEAETNARHMTQLDRTDESGNGQGSDKAST